MAVMSVCAAILRSLLAAVFLISAAAKLADHNGFRSALGDFGIPERLQPLIAPLVPALELLIGLGLLAARSAWPAALAAAGLLIAFTIVIIASLRRGRRPECHCFGQLAAVPVSWGSAVRNGVLTAAAAAILVRGPAGAGPSLVAWLGRIAAPEALALGAVVLIVTLAGLQARLFVHLLRQNGRLLLRLDALERAVEQAGLTAGGTGRRNQAESHQGLPPGTPAPAFQLPRLDGGTAGLAGLLTPGRPLALAFVDPYCGPCAALVPELARWQDELADRVTLALVSSGTVAANQEKLGAHDLRHVLLQDDREVSAAYRALATPSMVLVGPDGRIGSQVMAGRDAIRSLMAALTADEQDEQQAEVEHTRVGQPAPEVRLTDLEGGRVSLAALRGHPVLVLFWNPGCGFCQRMLDDLTSWEASRSPAEPRLVVISAGSAEASRAMRLPGTVALDPGFGTGRAFGASGTPSAVLIDSDGRIASGLAVGARAVLALAAGPDLAIAAGA